MPAQAELTSMLGESAAIDEFGASFGEWAFPEGREILIELARENELEDGVTKEFEPLVRLDWHALFVGDRWMRQGEPQESPVAKSVT